MDSCSSRSSSSSKLSTRKISSIVEYLKQHQHCDSTRKNYYAVWRLFNEFFIRLDVKPRNWEDRLTFFVGHLIQQNRQSSTVKSYVSAFKAVLKMNNIKIKEDQYLLSSRTHACRIKNDTFRARLLIQKKDAGSDHEIHRSAFPESQPSLLRPAVLHHILNYVLWTFQNK